MQTRQDRSRLFSEYFKHLLEWTKMLLSLDVVMGGGCLVILQNSAAQGMTRVFLVAAIIGFVASIVFSILQMSHLLTVLANIATDSESDSASVVDARHENYLVKILAYLQLLAFVGAAIFLVLWVILKIL